MIKKEQRTERLVLRGGGDVAFHGQMGKEGFHFDAAHVFGVTLFVK